MEQHQKLVVEVFRRPIQEFLLMKMSSHLTMELKSSKLTKADLAPWLKLIINYVIVATSIIDNSHANPEFIQSMFIVASQVFLPENEKF